MREDSIFVGIDTCKEFHQVAMWRGEQDRGVLELKVPNERRAIVRLARRLHREAEGRRVLACYEAGPCGFGLQRQLQALGIECMVVAPSQTPVKPGERVKTDRRDAKRLMEYLRSGTLTEVHPPTPREEAARDLCRLRDRTRRSLTSARHRLSGFLLRRDGIYPGKAWTKAHREWLRRLKFEEPTDQKVFEYYVREVEHQQNTLAELDDAVEELSQHERYRDAAGALRCLHGIDTVTAMGLLTELFDARRFESARTMMAYVGAVPSEHTTGGKPHRGAITKTGNSRVRRLLVEAAWHYQRRPLVGAALRRRRIGQPAWAIAIAEQARVRLHRRYWHLVAGNHKLPQVAITAVARELVGFVWAVLVHQDEPVAAEANATGAHATSGRPASRPSGLAAVASRALTRPTLGGAGPLDGAASQPRTER